MTAFFAERFEALYQTGYKYSVDHIKNMDNSRPRKSQILFRTQLVLFLAFILFTMLISLLKTCSSSHEQPIIRREIETRR